jgi:hypothetical protein
MKNTKLSLAFSKPLDIGDAELLILNRAPADSLAVSDLAVVDFAM